MQGQSKALQSLTQHRHHTLCVILSFKSEAAIVRIAHQNGFASQTRFDFFSEPQIGHVVQSADDDIASSSAARADP